MRAYTSSAPEAAPAPRRLGERLIEAGVIGADALERALAHQKRSGARLGECLVELSLLPEQALLRFLADEYRTRYVSAEKLSRTPISPEVLDRVPVRMAEQQALIPLFLDDEGRALSLVMAEPQNLQVLEEVRLVAGVDEVHAYIGLRSAVAAAVRRHYYGDTSAFERLGSPTRGDLGSLVDFYAHSSPARAPVAMDPVELARALVAQMEWRRRDMRSHALGVASAVAVVMDELGAPAEEREAARLAAYVHDLGKREGRHLTLMSTAGEGEFRSDARRMLRAPARLLARARLPERVVEILSSIYEAFDGTGLPEGRAGQEIPLGARVLAAADVFEDLRHNPGNPLGRALSREEAAAVLQREAGRLVDPAVARTLARYHAGDLLRERLAANVHPVLWVGPPPDDALLAGLRSRGLPVTVVGTPAAARPVLEAGGADLALCPVDLPRADGLAPAIALRPHVGPVPLLLTAATADAAALERALRLGADCATGPLEPAALAARVRKLLADRAVPPRPIDGSLDEVSLPSLLRLLARGQKTGLLALAWAAGTVELWLDRGRVVHARAGGTRGERALALLADLQRADIRFEPGASAPSRDLDRDLESVVADLTARTTARAS